MANNTHSSEDRLCLTRTSREFLTYPPVHRLQVALPDWDRLRKMIGRIALPERKYRDFALALFGAGVATGLQILASATVSTPPPTWLRVVYGTIALGSFAVCGVCLHFDRKMGSISVSTVSEVLGEMDEVAQYSGLSEEVTRELKTVPADEA